MRIPLLKGKDCEHFWPEAVAHIPAVAPGVHQLAQLGVHVQGVEGGVIVVVPEGGGGAPLLVVPG